MPPSPRPRPSRFRKLAGLAGLSAAAMVGGVVLAPAAFAHHPEVTATTDCSGAVAFTSTAWMGANEAQRTNPKIGVAYKVDGGPFVDLPQQAAYHYDAANSFTFRDSFTPAAGWHDVTVKVTALGEWGSGVAGGDSREATVSAATGCVAPAAPAATIAEATCAAGGAVVHLANTGGTPVDMTVAGQVVTVAPGATADVPVAVPAGTTTPITVTAPGMADVTRLVRYACAPPTTVPAAPVAHEVPVASPAVGADEATRPAPAGVLASELSAPSGQLPRTGTSTVPLVAVALASVLTGLGFMIAGRRTRRA